MNTSNHIPYQGLPQDDSAPTSIEPTPNRTNNNVNTTIKVDKNKQNPSESISANDITTPNDVTYITDQQQVQTSQDTQPIVQQIPNVHVQSNIPSQHSMIRQEEMES